MARDVPDLTPPTESKRISQTESERPARTRAEIIADGQKLILATYAETFRRLAE